MNREYISGIFDRNTKLLTLPLVVESGKDVNGQLLSHWEEYISFLTQTPELHNCIAHAINQKKLLANTLELYYSGQFAKANQCIYDIVQAMIDNRNQSVIELDFLDKGIDSKCWFRARIGNSFPFPKEALMHIPYDQRSKISNNRYSINGIPCLYIANSIFTCWEELNRPDLNSFWVNRYWPTHRVRLINLATTMEDLLRPDTNLGCTLEGEYDKAIEDYFSNWILQSACSTVVKESGRSFKEEYVIPQLLMASLPQVDIDGVMYFSTQMGRRKPSSSWISKCIAIPAFDITEGDNHSAKIENMFGTTHPVNLGLYQSGAITTQNSGQWNNGNLLRTNAIIFVSDIPTVYSKTVFYKCELELLSTQYSSI